MPRPRLPSDRRLRKWSDAQSDDCDRRVAVCVATLTSEHDPAKRLRIAAGLLRSVPELREGKRNAITELRSRGWTWRRIGAVIDVAPQTVRDQVTRRRPFPGREPSDQI